jgi:tetratricopeptide (TPR) repeat protein
MKIRAWILTLFIILNYSGSAQIKFKQGYEKGDPVAKESPLSIEEKIQVHQKFLQKATSDLDTLKQIYGQIYLFRDHIVKNEYAISAKNILDAELLANVSGNRGWQGIVNHMKGILQVKLKNFQAALELYKIASSLCGKAGDSLCLAESMEQMGALNGRLGNQQEAIKYFNQAIPLIRKFGDEMSLGITYNNYGNFLLKNDQATDAVNYYNLALEIYRKNKKHKEEAQATNNLASAYVKEKQYKLALTTYNVVININLQRNMPENLTSNYAGLAQLYEQTGDYKKANEYLNKYYELKDSLIGIDVQLEIADLYTKFNTQEKELALKKSELVLAQTRKNNQKQVFIILIICLFGIAGLIIWRYQNKKKLKELKQHRENLQQLTRVLIEKNSMLAELEIKLQETVGEKSQISDLDELDNNLYNKRILTDEDWASFKLHFENAYPGYLLRLRKAKQALTEAEERLFVLIKLNLKSKEIASMLGISQDSVKKARNRLRRRLNLQHEENLDDHVLKF